eukprot:4915165-Amphidinium_carterae.1
MSHHLHPAPPRQLLHTGSFRAEQFRQFLPQDASKARDKTTPIPAPKQPKPFHIFKNFNLPKRD